MQHIHYVTYAAIDKNKWDACISNAPNRLLYGFSFYLDAMARHWDALVLNDYEAVMPLVWNKKYFFHYLYQPYFTACLGVFGTDINVATLNDFLHAIPNRFKYWDFYLNYGNLFAPANFELYERINYVLPLYKSYEIIYSGYSSNIKRNIKKSVQAQHVIKKGADVDDVIDLCKKQLQKHASISDNEFVKFRKLYSLLLSFHKASTYAVFSAGGKLLASAVFFIDAARAYYILAGNHPDGKTSGASHALIDAFIKEYAGQNMVLDFEGSDVPNLAFFYSSFGALQENYPAIKLNRLPVLIKYFKK